MVGDAMTRDVMTGHAMVGDTMVSDVIMIYLFIYLFKNIYTGRPIT